MATCANCEREASYRHEYAEGFGTNYCQYHLPAFLFKARDLGMLQLPTIEAVAEAPVEEPVVEAVAPKKKTTTKVVEEAVAPTDA